MRKNYGRREYSIFKKYQTYQDAGRTLCTIRPPSIRHSPCQTCQVGLQTNHSSSFVVVAHQLRRHLPHPGNPQPIPTNKYTKKMTTIVSKAISLTFFHHILRLKPRLLTLKSLALPPSRSVLSTSKSIRSPRSNTLSMFSVIISLTPSISLCTLRMASSCPASVVP